MIPTIEDYLKGRVYITQDGAEDIHDSLSNVANACRDLIELHVKAALEAANESKFPSSVGNSLVEHTPNAKQSILNVYPENLIK